MQLAGYICPTTEEVAGESQNPAPPPPKPLPSSLLQLQTNQVEAVMGAVVPFICGLF